MKIVGLPRYSLSSLASGSTVPATMPLTNLTNGEAWDIARLTEVDPLKTYVEGVPAMPNGYYGPEPSVGGVAWPNHNLSLGATARTVLLDADAAAGTHAPERLETTAAAIIAGSWSGVTADVDEDPYSIDGSKMTCLGSSSLTPSLRCHMANPSANPKTGADGQVFRACLSWTGADPTSVTFKLYDNNILMKTLAYGTAGSQPIPDSGSIFAVYWDAADLTDPTGGAVQCQIDFVLSSVSDDISLEAIDWQCDSGVSAGSILGDTGWTSVTMDQYDAAWGATVSGTVGPGPQQTFLHSFSDANVSGVAKIVTYFRDPLNSDGYIDLGEFVVGPIFVPSENLDWGEIVTLRGHDRVVRSDGGGSWGIRREPTRSVKINLSNLTASEAQSLLERLWRAGGLLPFVVQIFDDATESRHTTLYVCAESLPRLSANYVDYRTVSFDAVEKF